MFKLKVLNIRLNGMLIGFFNIRSLFLKDQEQNFFGMYVQCIFPFKTSMLYQWYIKMNDFSFTATRIS